MESKELYKFTIFEEKESTIEKVKVDEKTGEEVVTKKKVTEKVPIEIILKKPTRRQIEEADLEYSVEMSKCIKKGILTKAMLAKKYSDTGGLMSETESQRLVDLYKSIYDLQSENLRLDASTSKSDEIKSRQEEIVKQLTSARKEIVDIESGYRALFDHTADSKAQNRVLLWYIINLTYIKKQSDSESKPYFKGKEFDEKLSDFYDKEEELSEQHNAVSKKLSTLVAFWFFNQASTKEEFEELDRKIEAGEL
jgi:hypothetical protein